MVFNLTNISPSSIEEALYEFAPAIILLVAIIVLRYFISRLLTTLYQRGYIGVGTKITIMRIMDSIFILVFSLFIIQSYVPSIVTYVIIVIFALLVAILFFYEIREFTAYITLQLVKYIKGRYLEINLPGHHRPIYGRIISMDPFSSTIEDIYGNRTYVANSLLLYSAIRETSPFIPIRIRIQRTPAIELKEVIDRLANVMRSGGIAVFRIQENQIEIEKIDQSEISLSVRVIPASLPVRINDLLKLIKYIENEFREYNPVIELISIS